MPEVLTSSWTESLRPVEDFEIRKPWACHPPVALMDIAMAVHLATTPFWIKLEWHWLPSMPPSDLLAAGALLFTLSAVHHWFFNRWTCKLDQIGIVIYIAFVGKTEIDEPTFAGVSIIFAVAGLLITKKLLWEFNGWKHTVELLCFGTALLFILGILDGESPVGANTFTLLLCGYVAQQLVLRFEYPKLSRCLTHRESQHLLLNVTVLYHMFFAGSIA